MTSRFAAPAAGILAGAAGLAVTELLAGILRANASPVVAVGETVIDRTPGPLAHRIIDVVGHADKALAVTGVVIVVLAVGAVAGRLWPRRAPLAATLIIAMAALGVAATLSRRDADGMTGWVCIFGAITTLVVLDWLSGAAEAAAAPGDESRRVFLRNAALVAAGTVLAAGAGRWVGRARVAVERARSVLRLPVRQLAVPAGVQLAVDGIAPWATPPDVFYRIDTALTVPLIRPADWRLRIHGMVDRELTLTFQDLLDRGLSSAWITLCCVSNEVGGDLIGNTSWSGVPIGSLLAEVGVRPGADALLSTSHDGWTAGTPLAALTDGRNALLAVAMNGAPLPLEHGFPVRQVVPGLYGYVSATKWVTDWEITRFDAFSAYWTERGWSERGPVKTESRIDVPGRKVPSGRVRVAGSAWAQHRGIRAVEVRVDGGAWQQATLAAIATIDTWVQWVWDWDATPGDHHLEVRATDATGIPQTAKRADVVPDGATGYHGRLVTVT